MKRKIWIRIVLIGSVAGVLGYVWKSEFVDFYRGFNTGFNGW